jgi:hypothetical protein
VIVQGAQRASRPASRRRVYLLVRRAGRSFGKPMLIAGGGKPAGLAVAISSRREVLAVWGRSGSVAARRVSASGTPSPPVPVPDTEPAGFLNVGLAESGRAVITGSTALAGESPLPRPATMTVSVAEPGGAFSTEVLERTEARGRSGSASPVYVHPAADDRLTLAWTGQAGDRAVVRTAEVTGARPGPAQVISDPSHDSGLAKLVAGGRGEALAYWFQYDDAGDFLSTGSASLLAAPRAPGATVFGPQEEIVTGNLFGADVAIDPLTGRAVAVWVSVDRAGTKVLTATRPAFR